MQNDPVQIILSDLIDLPERQMRRDINRDELHELAANIKANGLINPLTVRPKGGRYELVAGQRRYLAMNIAGIIRIPCVVRDLTDAQAVAVMASENLERSDVDPVDEANFIKMVMDAESLSVSQMAERLRRGDQYVKDRLLVASMPDYLRDFLKHGEIKLGVALHLMSIEPEEKRRVWVGMAIEQNISVRTATWWAEQHRIGTLPSAVSAGDSFGEAPAGEPRQILFECELDGSKHPPAEMVTFMVWRENAPAFLELGRALRAQVGGNAIRTERGEEPDAVAAAPSGAGLGEEATR